MTRWSKKVVEGGVKGDMALGARGCPGSCRYLLGQLSHAERELTAHLQQPDASLLFAWNRAMGVR